MSAVVTITGEVIRVLEPTFTRGEALRSASVRVAGGSGSLVWLVQAKGEVVRLLDGLRVGDMIRAHGEMLASITPDHNGSPRLNMRLHAHGVDRLTPSNQIGKIQ